MPTSHLRAHYSLKHRAIARVSQWLDSYTYTVRHGLLAGMKRKGGLGFLPAAISGHQETAETRFLSHLDLTDAVVYDIGGFQGLLTMFFSMRARTVVVYEPNPISRHRLEENLALNHIANVTVRPVGVGARAETTTLVFDPLMPGAATAHSSIGGQIRDTATRWHTADVRIVSLDEDRRTERLPDPSLVKIDVEGLELDVLRGMSETLRTVRPALYIEMHGATMDEKRDNARAVVELLADSGYAMQHVESGSHLTRSSSALAAQGHLFCTPENVVRP